MQSRSTLFVLVCFLAAMSSIIAGCAHQQDTATATQSGDSHPQQPVSVVPQQQTLEENGAVYEIINTPFGVVKRKTGTAETPEEPADGADDVQQTASVAPPLNEKPPLISTREKSRILFKADGSDAAPLPGQVSLNFDDADLYEVIRTIAELLQINYIVDPMVKGKVTIQTAGSLNKSDLMPIFYQILETNGLTAVKEGPLYKIAPIKDAGRMPITARYGRQDLALPPSERIIMQIIPLHNIDADQMVKLLTPFISADGTVVTHTESNTIVLVDKGVTILKALKLVEAFDLDLFTGVSHRFFKIEHTSVEDISKPLQDVLSAYAGKSKDELKVIPIEHLNMLLVLSPDPRLFDNITKLIDTLDTPNETVQPSIYVYSVKNGAAQELADLLDQIFGSRKNEKSKEPSTGAKPTETSEEPTSRQGNPFARKKDQPAKSTAAATPSQTPATGMLRGEIKITPDQIRNALIIEAVPSDYQIVTRILERLDVMPRQVLIEAMIAEIKLDNNTKFGVDWSYSREDGSSPTAHLLSAAINSTVGLQYVIGQTDRWSAILTALASEDKVNILSSPTVLASNDKAATINISTEVPVASAQYQYNDASSQPVVTTNIEYRNTGIILDVTPHINENGLVSMEISQEVSEQAGEVIVGDASYPSFFQRTVNTTLTVSHNQTIVIGGLIRENRSAGQAGVPGVSKIPIIGSLFGTNSETKSKSELIILITPRVIVNLNDVDMVTEAFKSKVPNAM